MMAASDMRRMRARVGTVPSRVLAARSRRARALLCERPAGAELLVGGVEEVLGRGVGAGARFGEGEDGREGFDEAAMDGCGGLAVQLLVDDGFDECLERRLRTGDAQGAGADAGDEAAEFGVGGGECAAGQCGVVTRGAWAMRRTRHEWKGTASCV